jgi:hypothetical protein
MRTLVLAWAWRTLVVTLSALTLGLTWAHVLELPQRLGYDAELWTSLTEPNALYRYFGVIGGPIEVAAVIGTIALAAALRRQHLAGRLALVAAVLHAAALAVWVTVVAPANAEIGTWSASGIPADWTSWRDRWETGHAASFGLLLLGFVVLVLALLAEQRQRARAAPAPNQPG